MLTYEETVQRMGNAAAVVKLITGVANNAAWLVTLNALDHARRCPNYRHRVKHLFMETVRALKQYEKRLIYASENRMFHLADHVAWVMVAMAALDLAVQMYRRAIDECVNGYQLPRRMVEQVFGQFSLAEVADRWRKALIALCPGTDQIKPTPTDERNIELGLEQLCQAWADPSTLYGSTMDTVEEYKEVFRTKGEQKKSLREIAEVQQETERELANS